MIQLFLFGGTSWLVVSCAELQPRRQPQQGFGAREVGSGREVVGVFAGFRERKLQLLIAESLRNNPTVALVASRLRAASVVRRQAGEVGRPQLTAGFGLQEGKFREVGENIRERAPIFSRSSLRWELDPFGKFKAGRAAAREGEKEAVFALQQAQLVLAAEVAQGYFRLGRLGEEEFFLRKQRAAQRKIVGFGNEALKAGLEARAGVLKEEKRLLELDEGVVRVEKLKGLAESELGRLLGRTTAAKENGRLVGEPVVSGKTLGQLLRTQPRIQAAEAEVRRAFQLEESARLDLLPGFSLSATLGGAQRGLTERFMAWEALAAAGLTVPVYDARRRAALRSRRVETNQASLRYRGVVLDALAEADQAMVAIREDRRLLQNLQEQRTVVQRLLGEAQAKRAAGLAGEREVLRADQAAAEVEKAMVAIRQALLEAHVKLRVAIGG